MPKGSDEQVVFVTLTLEADWLHICFDWMNYLQRERVRKTKHVMIMSKQRNRCMTRIHTESRNVIIATEQLQENKCAHLPAAGELFTVCELLILAAGTGPTEIRLGAGTGRVLPSITCTR